MAKRKAVGAVAAVLVASTLGPVRAPATDGGGGCGRDGVISKWSTSGLCHFQFRGFPVTVFGDAEVSSGLARVRVWVTDGQVPGGPALLECEDEAAAYASCDDDIGGTGGLVSCNPSQPTSVCADAGAWLHPLTCHVSGRGSGAYWCQSGDGR